MGEEKEMVGKHPPTSHNLPSTIRAPPSPSVAFSLPISIGINKGFTVVFLERR